ncbi:MAG: ABC transporter permease [Spirochaetes bacterium GWB1_59_5]|nr:MAG: ABC transporter permease [Spirochaetes bacterium GWB1_59_5]
MGTFLINWAAYTPTVAVPLLLATLGLIISERAGVLSLTVEGMMLIGAMVGIAAYLMLGGSPYVSFVVAMLAAAAVSLIFATLVILLRVNQAVAGIAMVFLCQGLTSLLGEKMGWANRSIPGLRKMDLGALSSIPVIGKILFSQDLMVYLAVPLTILVLRLLEHTQVGLKLRAVGENPEAADAAGIHVLRTRFGAVIAGSALMGVAGAYLSVASSKLWIHNLVGGRGWIAVALVIFARWSPWKAAGGALLFGCIEAVIPRLSAMGLQFPQYFVLMTPYLMTIAVMVYAALSQRSRLTAAPAALGEPYVREERR